MTTFEFLLAVLAASVCMVALLRTLKLPPLLGYLCVGILFSPFVHYFWTDTVALDHLAEFGVVCLMFSIGLEFNLNKLYQIRRQVFLLGGSQVTLTALLGFLAAYWYGLAWQPALVLGCVFAMSSTAIVSKLLIERLEVDTPYGREILGVALFQDLAVVPMLILVTAMNGLAEDLPRHLLLSGLKAALLLAVILRFGQPVMRAWFNLIARRQSRELFSLNVLLVTFGLAYLTEVAGLSLALGAFLAGLLIAETQYSCQVEADISPFRDTLLGLFFVTLGLKLDLMLFQEEWLVILLLSSVPLLLKFLVIFSMSRILFGRSGTAIRVGVWLCSAGEFGFVLLSEASKHTLIDPQQQQIVLAAMLISMFASPLLIAYSGWFSLRFSREEWEERSLTLTKIAAQSHAIDKHVILVGYGRNGQSLGRVLEQENIRYLALDLDVDRVREAKAAGEPVVYGDALQPAVLAAAGIHRAAILVIAFDDPGLAKKILHQISQMHQGLPVVVRTRDDRHMQALLDTGASEVVPEVLETTLMLASHTMMTLGMPISKIVKKIRTIRRQRYGTLRGFFYGAEQYQGGEGSFASDALRLHAVEVHAGDFAVGKTVGQLELDTLQVDVALIRRKDMRRMSPPLHFLVQEGDILVLAGTLLQTEMGEQRLAVGGQPA